jgi:AcrR family transcriptional regulator
MAARTTPARKGLGPAERRQTLVDAGWDLLAAGGPRAVTIDAVVERLGITRPIFYRHFRDRGELLAALYGRYADEFVATMDAVLFGSAATIGELLQTATAAYFELVDRQGIVIRPLVEAAQDDERMAAARAELRDRMQRRWTVALTERVPPGRRDRMAQDPALFDTLAALIQVLQATSMEGATIFLDQPARRPAVVQALAVLLDDIEDRFFAHASPDAG